MKLSIFFDKTIHDTTARHAGLDIEVSSFNFVSDIGFLQLHNRHGALVTFWHVVGVIASEPTAEAEYWARRWGGPVAI